MSSLKFTKLLLVSIGFALSGFLSGFGEEASLIPRPDPSTETTASHSYQISEDIIAEIKLLRQASGATGVPREPGVQVKKVPFHVYAKYLEIMEKIRRTRDRMNLSEIQALSMPTKAILPKDIQDMGQRILHELREIKTELKVTATIAPAPLPEGKSPSNVYENLGRASYLLDGIAGETDPNDVFRNVRYVLRELTLIANQTNIPLNIEPPLMQPGKRPHDVTLEGFKNLYKLVKVESKLGMTGFGVPHFPSGHITPSDALDTTNMLLAELVRIKVHLHILAPWEFLPVPEGKQPSDVLVLMRQVGLSLDQFLESL
ncbi:MAG TPA: hypothetical protein EYQ50_22225 [Verrucomicrobiales bacterium]|nr:hypothetical protein [Verrucomicrobiales bacterium]HIL70536.1 hypothetical protein [Verrucomicrobiota bacterium]